MKNKLSIIVLLLAAATLVTALAGCSPAGETKASTVDIVDLDEVKLDPANPIKVMFYNYGYATSVTKPGMEHLVNSFNETIGKEKGIIVEGVADTGYTKSTTDIQAGLQVDLVQQVFPTLDLARKNLGYKAFEDVFPTGELNEHFNGIEKNALQLGMIDGKTYGMAFTFSTPILYINNTLFKQAGLDPANPPKTWDEVYEVASQINERTGKFGLSLAPANGWVTYGVFYSNGAEMFDKDGKVVFASPEGIAAVEQWKKFNTAGLLTPGTDAEASEAFIAGNVGMSLTTTAYLSRTIAAFDQAGLELSMAGMPTFGDKPAIPVNSGSCLSVRPDTPEKAKAVWEFVKYATSSEGYTIITSEIGYLPLRSSVVDDPKYLKSYADQYPVIRLNLEQLKTIRGTIWPAAIATQGRQIFQDALDKALTTDADVESTLKQAQSDINALYQ